MAEKDGFGRAQGNCDLCGVDVDETEELNQLSCSYASCGDNVYHQECLEKFLKGQKLERNRKTGFKCPRGCGKGTKFPNTCPGRIDKSHPIHPRNQEKKKGRQAFAAQVPEVTKVVPKPAVKAKAAEKDKKPDVGKKEADKGKQTAAVVASDKKALAKAIASKNAPTPVLLDKRVERAAPPASKATFEEMLAAKARLQAELKAPAMGAQPGPSQPGPPPAAPAEKPSVLAHLLQPAAARAAAAAAAASSAAPAGNAWTQPGKLQAAVGGQQPERAQSSELLQVQRQGKKAVLLSTQAQGPDAAAAGGGGQAGLAAPLPPKRSADLASSSLAAAQAGGDEGSQAEDGVEESAAGAKLTKGQRKAQRAKEKERAAAEEAAALERATLAAQQQALAAAAAQRPEPPEVQSSTHDGLSDVASELEAAEAAAVLEELAIHNLAVHKILHHVRQLQLLGVSELNATLAVQRCGSDEAAALHWLLSTDLSDPQALLQSAAALSGSGLPVLDLSVEMHKMEAIVATGLCSMQRLHEAVSEANGDLVLAVDKVGGASSGSAPSEAPSFPGQDDGGAGADWADDYSHDYQPSSAMAPVGPDLLRSLKHAEAHAAHHGGASSSYAQWQESGQAPAANGRYGAGHAGYAAAEAADVPTSARLMAWLKSNGNGSPPDAEGEELSALMSSLITH